MKYTYQSNPTLTSYARINKKHSTEAEKYLWYQLRNRNLNGHKFRRQYPIDNYILDFYCIEKKLAVELDGSQHMEHKDYDNTRTTRLKHRGIHVLRFWDNEVLKDIKSVLEKIIFELERIS